MPRMVACAAGSAAVPPLIGRRVALAVLIAAAPLSLARAPTSDTPSLLQLRRPGRNSSMPAISRRCGRAITTMPGCTVEIRPGSAPGQTTVDPSHEVTEGHAQFGVGSMQLVTRAAQGLPLLLLAPIFQTSGAEIYYRADSDFGSPGALLKGKIGRLPATDISRPRAGHGAARRRHRSGQDRLGAGRARPGASPRSPTVRIDAIAGSAWDFPWQARARSSRSNRSTRPITGSSSTATRCSRCARFDRGNPAVVSVSARRRSRAGPMRSTTPTRSPARLVSDLPPPPGITDPAGFAHYQVTWRTACRAIPTSRSAIRAPNAGAGSRHSLADVGALVAIADPDALSTTPTPRHAAAPTGATARSSRCRAARPSR